MIYFLPVFAFSQVIDSILPPPQVKLPSLVFEKEDQKIDLEWADTIIREFQKIYFVQLRPLCEDGKKRKTLPPYSNDKKSRKRRKGCYEETVIIDKYIFRIENDPRSIEIIVNGFDLNRIYKWKEIDTADYTLTIESTLGKRESNSITMCYNPRHAVVFFDSTDKIMGIYEICFECGNGKIAFNSVESISIYPEDYLALKNLFIKYDYIEQKKKNTGNLH